ncbi:MAG: hypothetical protein ACLSAF_07115 [Intestinimonas sp.]
MRMNDVGSGRSELAIASMVSDMVTAAEGTLSGTCKTSLTPSGPRASTWPAGWWAPWSPSPWAAS